MRVFGFLHPSLKYRLQFVHVLNCQVGCLEPRDGPLAKRDPELLAHGDASLALGEACRRKTTDIESLRLPCPIKREGKAPDKIVSSTKNFFFDTQSNSRNGSLQNYHSISERKSVRVRMRVVHKENMVISF